MTREYRRYCSKEEIARRARERGEERERALAGVIDRDPCTYCGTRADIGCRHNRRAA